MKDDKIIKNLSNLKKLRESKNITQLKLSIDLGVSQELISRYELGSSMPQPNMLIQLANYFNCSVDYLLGLTDIPTPIRLLASNTENTKSAELYSKYEKLSNDDKKYFNIFLDALSNSKNSN